MLWRRDRQTCPVKSQVVNILGFVSHTASVATTQNLRRQYVNEWAWLCSINTLFMDTEI